MALKATQEMCAVCFDMLFAALRNQPTGSIIERFFLTETQVNAPCPIFVTWKINKSDDLRGCIGTFDQGTRIGDLLPRYALISAFNDTRFDPISLKEAEHLSVSVSLLTNFIRIKHPLDWEVGKHGIEINFSAKGKKYSATFLPEVSKDQGWDQATTLVNLFRKACYMSYKQSPLEIIQEISPTLNVKTYQSSKQSMSYENYQAYRSLQT
ncbi:unnamed protein product [Blepharisma stoltei]|uniref:AMMECR1 domain-containing protein n=1 Tax=Blepharisma stoltei TaxID=1481888 RepID=A0AAU9IPV9_9CILI|nr:unnamed protein product [Blepharisma stoltei]